MKKTTPFLFMATLFIALLSCGNNRNQSSLHKEKTNYKTKHVVIIIIDGARYSEMCGDEKKQYIPHLAKELFPQGVVCTNFFNNGYTYTTSGHAAVTTGFNQKINNEGKEEPEHPSIFQLWRKERGTSTPLSTRSRSLSGAEMNGSRAEMNGSRAEMNGSRAEMNGNRAEMNGNRVEMNGAWLITSKGKLQVLADCKDTAWKGKFLPSNSCGTNEKEIHNDFRADSLTAETALNIVRQEHPQLVLIQFKDPDINAHAKNWNAYLQGIRDADKYIYTLWNFLQTDSIYAGTTTMFVTNDHGRHLDNVKDGFASHGDDCEGCRHINFFAAGPDFKKGSVVSTTYNQIDIPMTVADLLGFSIPDAKGKVMEELFIH